MFLIAFVLSFIAIAHAASVVPVQSSHVDVRRSGNEFSYNIQENHGLAAINQPALPLVAQSLVKIHHEEKHSDEEPHKEKKEEPEAKKIELQQDLLKKTEDIAIIPQPLLTSALEYHPYNYYYYPYSGYSLTSFPRTLIQPSAIPAAIPYPYTLFRTI